MYEQTHEGVLELDYLVRKIRKLVEPRLGQLYHCQNWKPVLEESINAALAGGWVSDGSYSLRLMPLPSELVEMVEETLFFELDGYMEEVFGELRDFGIFELRWHNTNEDDDFDISVIRTGDTRIAELKRKAQQNSFRSLGHGDYYPESNHP